MKRPVGAIAVDLGATSGRFAAGWSEGGELRFEVIEQIPHAPVTSGSHSVWDIDLLLGLCRRAVTYGADNFEKCAVGIDAWGVDHGFLNDAGKLVQSPVAYRDETHIVQFEKFAAHRSELFSWTGIAAQPFNTIYQLAARKAEGMPPYRWLPLPDLLGFLLGGGQNIELTEASTTGLLGLDGAWCHSAFDLIGWPVPDLAPLKPSESPLVELQPGVVLSRVGSHDTASAVHGLGELDADTMFLNVGTWALAGVILDTPLATPEAEKAGFTNERTVDGRIRFLKNVPGFFVVNRLHEELGIESSVPEWLATASGEVAPIDFLDESLYSPGSMVSSVQKLAGETIEDSGAWAQLALASMAATISAQIEPLEALIGRPLRKLRVSGGGSKSAELCQALSNHSGRTVLAGPGEATVLGNLAVSLGALGVSDFSLKSDLQEFRP